MNAYAQVLLIAIPFFFVLIFIEFAVGYWKGKQVFKGMDTISSLSSGMTNTLKSVLKLTVIIISYAWLVEQVAFFEMPDTWWVWALSFIALDFASYWNHRLNHSINYFWNRHIVHHSSEEFNLACALRQSISSVVSLGFIFLFPAALLGLPAKMIAVLAPIHLFAQFWYHTTLIGKMGWLEYIIVTPSQHRVHHAINKEYVDKNLAAIFCIWDRMFGTFQEELEEAPCVYGVTRAVRTWNPIKINYQHLWLLIQDAWRAKNWWDKMRIWFMPTGWRPADVKEKYPVHSIKNPYEQEKYNPILSKNLQIWSWFQYILTTLLLLQMILVIDDIPLTQLFMYGGFLFLMVYSYTSLMDKDPNSVWFEAVKSSVGLAIIYTTGDWFLLNDFMIGGTALMGIYLVGSVGVVGYFVRNEIKKEHEKALNWK